MTHEEFVQAYRTGKIAARVNRSLALQLMGTTAMAKRYRAAHLFWSWVWFLSVPAAIACMIWVRWWIGLIVLITGFALPKAIKQSAAQFVIEQALDDEQFYNLAIESKVLMISERA